jgi:hypothetical protein
VFQNFSKQKWNFSINLKTLEHNQNVLMCSKFFKTVFLTNSLTTFTGTFLASATLSRPQLTFSGTSLSLSRHSDISMPLLTLSRPLKHSQGLCSLQALSWLVIDNSLELSHGCESVVEAVRNLECCILSQPLWAPLRSSWALSRPLLAPLRPLLAL